MKRLSSAMMILLLSLARAGHPQDQPQFRYHLPCAQVIHMGLNKYFARYTAAIQDQSTAGCVEAYESYAHCRRSVSDRQMTALSKERQKQVTQIRQDLGILAGACYNYIYLSAGGGTMWSQMEADNHALREDFLAVLIADMHHLHHSSLADRRRADVSLRAGQRSLMTLRVPQAEGAATLQPSYVREYRSKTYPAARAAFVRLRTLTAALPDTSARRLAHELQQQLAKPAENLR